ncbi:carbon monoxide dehydrogenase subunit G [Streptosporangium sp. 'caverna']|uniref:SRPBCC family protein n=1 Tax=Streptosporangium sp. 'caverna' TaxID=2202249 RepID=UPI000D7DF614|nr:carbon monoxide dehydrogenase subunit G [Streptosporangium sp. 'caverna']AWS45339.1 carbon monoxide dehydrogenase [Streptosporangium sp. 'caverna']
MKLAGSAVLGIDRDRVWSALQNPAVLVCTIPGCERLEETGPDTYRMMVTAGVASIKGVYQGEVALSEPDAPQRFVLRARGQGAPGTVDAVVEVRLSEVEGGTRVDYDAEAVIGGMIGGVGQRMLSSVAKKTAKDFFAAIESHLVLNETAVPVPVPAATAPAVPVLDVAAAGGPSAAAFTAPAAPGVPGVPGTAGQPGTAQVFERPAKQPRPGVPAWSLLAGFGMGAGVALGSAVIGWLLGRSSRKR